MVATIIDRLPLEIQIKIIKFLPIKVYINTRLSTTFTRAFFSIDYKNYVSISDPPPNHLAYCVGIPSTKRYVKPDEETGTGPYTYYRNFGTLEEAIFDMEVWFCVQQDLNLPKFT